MEKKNKQVRHRGASHTKKPYSHSRLCPILPNLRLPGSGYMRQVPLLMSDVQVVFLSCLVAGSASTAEVLCAGQSAFARGGVPSSGRKHKPAHRSHPAPCHLMQKPIRSGLTSPQPKYSPAVLPTGDASRTEGEAGRDVIRARVSLRLPADPRPWVSSRISCVPAWQGLLRERGRESISAWLKSPLTSPLAQRVRMEAFSPISSHGAVFTH